MTQHSEIRIQQRGAQKDAVSLIQVLADRRIRVGGGCVLLAVSRDRVQAMRKVFSNSTCSRVARTGLIVNDAGDIVTVLVGAMVDTTAKKARRHS